MKTIKELEDDLELAKGVNHQEWITQLEAKLQDRKDILQLIDEGCGIEDNGKIYIDKEELKEGIKG